MPILRAERASFRYPGRPADTGPFDAEIRAGDLHLVSGRSGCGKSTLARILSGLIPHLYRGRFDGDVFIADRRTSETPLWQIATRVGLVTQNPAAQLLASTVTNEIGFGLENLGLPDGEIDARVDHALAAFGLEALAERDPRTLSGGEQQKLVLAAVAARRPEALILDEPLSMLEAVSARTIVDYLDGLRRSGTAVVVFEHRRSPFAHLRDVRRHELPMDAANTDDLPPLAVDIPAFRLHAEDLSVELGGRPVLDGIDFAVASGQVVAVLGPNGAGKTTFLRAICGLQPHAGRITGSLDGAPIRPRLGLCFQNPDRQLFNPTVRSEILFNSTGHDERFYRSVVDLLGLTKHEDSPPLLLSEGQKKRLGLAIMLVQPGLCGICLDEPTLGQDQENCRLLGRILRRLAAAGYLCLVATHDRDWAAQWSDQVLLLRNGGLVASDALRVDSHDPAPPRHPRRVSWDTTVTTCEQDAASF